jgi:hypothetical protein
MSATPDETVHRWLSALNAGDAERVLALTSPDARLVGPRGAAVGHAVLRGWLEQARATFATDATSARGPAVVVAQRGVWHDAAGAPLGGAVTIATRFLVVEHRVAELERYDTLSAALAAAQLDASDRIAPAPDELVAPNGGEERGTGDPVD